MPLLGVDEVGKFQGVPDEKYRGVVAHQIVIALFGIKFDREPPGVPGGVGGAFFAAHGGKADEDLGALSYLGEEFRLGVAGDVGGHLKVTAGAGALGVHHPFGNALPVEVAQLFQQVRVLHQYRTPRPGGKAVLIVGHGDAEGGGEGIFFLGHGFPPCLIESVRG
jgi:hypothetical protein